MSTQQVSTGASLIQKKRLSNESKLLKQQPLGYISAYPDEHNPLIWYFLLVGQKGTQYYGGQYIGEIHHSPKYPAEPPDYYMRTPNGRYEIDKKICLTNSSYHKGDWSSTWNILSILIAFYSIWLDDGEHGISHIKKSPEERKKLANESIQFNRTKYAKIYEKFDFSTLTDDVDNAPKVKQTVSTETNQTGQTNQTTESAQTTESVQTINTETVQPVQQVNTETKVEEHSKILVETPSVFSGNLVTKFEEMNKEINKINNKIKLQEDEINNLIKEIATNK